VSNIRSAALPVCTVLLHASFKSFSCVNFVFFFRSRTQRQPHSLYKHIPTYSHPHLCARNLCPATLYLPNHCLPNHCRVPIKTPPLSSYAQPRILFLGHHFFLSAPITSVSSARAFPPSRPPPIHTSAESLLHMPNSHASVADEELPNTHLSNRRSYLETCKRIRIDNVCATSRFRRRGPRFCSLDPSRR
jgi:hypothetical protein